MLKRTAFFLLLFLLTVSIAPGTLLAQSEKQEVPADGTLEKMIVESGQVAMDVNLSRYVGGKGRTSGDAQLRFSTDRNSLFTILVFNGQLRGPMPSAMPLVPQAEANLPARLSESYHSLALENLAWGGQFELVIRDSETGFTFFNIEGQEFGFKADIRELSMNNARVLLSREFAAALGRPGDAGTVVGRMSLNATMRASEVTQIADGQIQSETTPGNLLPGTRPGPDVVVGDVYGLAQFGSAVNGFVGLALGTVSCNYGTIDLNWFQLPNNDHPVIPQNLYRMSGGADNAERFEQIAASQVKHGFTALTQNLCLLGCNGVGGSRLGSGCSDPYSASLNAGPDLGSRAWINPFTGFFPRGDSATPPNNHSGHVHDGPGHRMRTAASDLLAAQNPGARYFAEGQYVTPHEWQWCQSNPGQCHMNNNVAYREYSVTGTATSFSFSPISSTFRERSAILAWSGATFRQIEPAPGVDGIGTVAFKVTQTGTNTWHYEYAVYNQNLDRAIQSFAVPIGNGAQLTNIGFKAPPQQPGSTGDGTVNNLGFSSTPWQGTVNNNLLTWQSETFIQNQNANAIRWGTLYNFRFDSNSPPTTVNATIGFYKTGAPITVAVQGPSATVAANVSISGRVLDSNGVPVRNALVALTVNGGATRTTRTNTFGGYIFANVSGGVAHTIGATAKGLTFTSVPVTPTANVTDMNLVASGSL